MLTTTIDVHNIQMSFEDLLALIREGSEVIFTDANTPFARVIPLTIPNTSRIAGLHAGAIWTSDDFDEPLPEAFWMGSA